jgi:hypothetical protein
MQERNVNINGLKRKAYAYAYENASIDHFENIVDQKFTELLIERCTELADLAQDNQLRASEIIKRHFGIED